MQRPLDILLVEPNRRHAAIMRKALARFCKSCPLKIAQEPEQAKRLIDRQLSRPESKRPFLVIAEDCKQPRALDLIIWLREHPRMRHMPVIVLGLKDDPSAIRLAYELGASSYIVKPTDDQELGQTVAAAAQYWGQLNYLPDWAFKRPLPRGGNLGRSRPFELRGRPLDIGQPVFIIASSPLTIRPEVPASSQILLVNVRASLLVVGSSKAC